MGRISQVPGDPCRARAAGHDPGVLSACPGSALRFDDAFGLLQGLGAHDDCLSGLTPAARSLAVYASRARSPSHHARLASRCLCFPGRVVPLGSIRGFQLISSSLAKLLLAQAASSTGFAPPAVRAGAQRRASTRASGARAVGSDFAHNFAG